MISKEEALKKIAELTTQFGEHIQSYKHKNYNETQTRIDFINPFFKALGWDMDNSANLPEAYREVIHEARQIVEEGGNQKLKAPDYAFRSEGGKDVFFLEAKKPSVMLKDDVIPAYQVRRYGWSAKHPITIITDFEEFSVYDCSKKPNRSDKASVARIHYLKFDEYCEKFDFLWDNFSREAVLKGSLEKFATAESSRKGAATVDKEFLLSLDKWRTMLATDINAHNTALDEDELNYAVQQTIDRIIFLRIAEDRSVETYGSLKDAIKTGNYYNNLLDLFKKADQKYNSGLFDFKKDTISPRLAISNDTLKSILIELYYPESPYEFSVLAVEILGSAYEQFLGKQITIDSRGKAIIEEKPAVRKAGGVYYTPQYIVDYIVQNTVGALCEGKTPQDIAALKIVDPACGSGSFLLGAYGFLLRWYKDYYTANAKALKSTIKNKKDFPLTPDGNLTTAEKKRILLANIYGVDIDVNAVEVTKLSLLLKCLEGETGASIDNQLMLLHDRILPTLDHNIRSGNSLIDTDFYDSEIDFGEEKKIKPFSWQRAFPEVFKNGGFDAVIGNPPYGAEFIDIEKEYLLKVFKNQNYQLDSYLIFLEQSIRKLLKINGLFGMIIPNPWLTNLLQKKLRKYIVENSTINEIVHFKSPVFPKVTVDTEIVILEKSESQNHIVKVTYVDKGKKLLEDHHFEIIHEQEDWKNLNGDTINIFLGKPAKILLKKIEACSSVLEKFLAINVGIKPYQVGKGKPPQKREDVTNRTFDSTFKVDDSFRRYLRGTDINRFKIEPKDRFIKYGMWLAEPRPAANFDAAEKIVMRQTGDSLIAAFDNQQHLCLNNMHVLTPKDELEYNLKFILGIVNSELMNWYYQSINPEKGEALAEVKKTVVANLPLKTIDFKNPTEKAHHDEIVRHVDTLLKLHAERQATTLPTRLEQIDARIHHSEQRINDIVYMLYGITDEERIVIES